MNARDDSSPKPCDIGPDNDKTRDALAGTIIVDITNPFNPIGTGLAGDDPQAKASVSAFIKSLGLRPQDTGDLSMAHWLEGAGLLSVGVGRYGAGDFNSSLGVKFG